MNRDRLKEKYMRLAIEEAGRNLGKPDGGPFGACITKGSKILAVARNTVLKNDATCHAEINAIRQASKKIRDFDLSGCTIYSTTEPCPMCFSAIHWARIEAIAYGTSISDVGRRGFNEMPIPALKLKSMGKSRLRIYAGFLRDECEDLLKKWDKSGNKRLY